MEETNVNAQVETSQEPQTQLNTAEAKPAEASNDATQNPVLNESQPEGSVSDVAPTDDKLVQPTTENVVETKPDTSDDISEKLRRLEEYEVRDKELQDLKTKLGSKAQEEDNVIFGAKRELALLENQAQQEYIKLCTQFGVDYRPEKIDESAQALLEKDPKAYYELTYRLQGLEQQVTARRNEVTNFITQRDISLAMQRNKSILETSPAINNVVQSLVREGGIDGSQIDNIIQYGMLVAREAFEMGRQASAEAAAKPSPSQVLNNNVIAQQATTALPTGKELTMADVAAMSVEEYAKNEALIDKLYAEGKLR